MREADNAEHRQKANAAFTRRSLVMALCLGTGFFAGVIVNLLGKAAASDDASYLLGWLAPANVAWFTLHVVEPLGKIFLRLILCVVLPLVFSALVLAVVELRDIRQLGRLGLGALLLTVVLSTTSVLIGLVLLRTVAPGTFFSPELRDKIQARYPLAKDLEGRSTKPLSQILLDLIPENPLQEAVGALDGSAKGNGMLALMTFAVLVGCAASAVGPKSEILVSVFDGLFAVSMKVVDWAMWLAPFGVACLMFAAGSQLGLELFKPLIGFLGVVLAGLLLQLFVVYPVVLRTCGVRPSRFYGAIGPVMLTAFGTASSNATLPTAIQTAETKLGVTRQIARFVLTVGATGNQNGTALYEGVVILFLAQVFGVELSLLQQLSVLLFAILAGVGTAGIPGGSIPMIMAILAGISVPPEAIGLILGFDRFLDMCRTVVNVTGDLTIAQCLHAWSRAKRAADPRPPLADA